MPDWSFHPEFVNPFYLQLMSGRIVTQPLKEQHEFLRSFRECAVLVLDDELRAMLFSGWRSSKVAAWYIAFARRTQFSSLICRLFQEQPSYADHFCICLSRLQGVEAQSALVAYLQGCADGSLKFRHDDETISPEWAVCALEQGFHAEEQAKRLWNEFMERQTDYPLNYWQTRLERVRPQFARIMIFLESDEAG